MWNDNDTNIDLIDYTHLVYAVSSIVKQNNLLPCTIGLFGDWGSGKSSLMRMIEESFNNESEILCIKFNGWLFEGYDDARSALMTSIIEQTISNRTLGEKAKNIAKKLLRNIDWLKLAKTATMHGATFLATGGIGNIALGLNELLRTDDKVEKIAKAFSDGKYDEYIKKISSSDSELEMGIREFHSDFGELLKETKIKKLIVFIDDLDRCLSDTVIATLEAIKLFLFAPNTAFVIGADEQLIQYAIKSRFPEIPGEKEVSRDYLEKLIQIPLRIPPMSELEVETYINLLFTQQYFDEKEFEIIRNKVIESKNKELFSSIYNSETAKNHIESDIPQGLMEDLILSRQIIPILSAGLNGNPRQCKRFLNTLLLRMQMANTKGIEIKKRVLAKLMLLEYFKPESYKTLFKWQSDQNGKSKELKFLEYDEKNSSKKIKIDFKKIGSWLEDTWLKTWLKVEPNLSDEDLRPYFYFARDILSQKMGVSLSRMSNVAQDILKNILSESESISKKGILSIKDLPLSDVTSIFQELTNKLNQVEDSRKRTKLLKNLIDIAENIDELQTEVISFLRNFPVKLVSISIIPKLISCYEGKVHEKLMRDLIIFWSDQQEYKGLSIAAKKHINKKE